MTITEKAKQKLDSASKDIKDAVESLKNEVEELSQKVKEKLKGAGDEMKVTAQELTKEVKNLREKVTHLIPQKQKSQALKVQVNKGSAVSEREKWERPFLDLQRATNRLFEDFFRDFGLSQAEKRNLWGLTKDVSGNDWPFVDMSENKKEIIITAELPGVEKNDIDISISENRIGIRGEKKQHKENSGRNFYRMECSYGSFQRTLELPCEVETEKVDATFNKGVLRLRLPKTEKAVESVKRIKVRPA